jgi:hypothetical protein
MAGRQTQRGKPALRDARKILRTRMREAPQTDWDRERTKPGMRDGARPIRS